MIEIFKKTYLAGADFAHKTWDEVEGRANEVVRKAKLGEKESAKFLKDLKKRYDGTQGKLEKYVEKVVKNILKKMDIATGADIKALQKEIRLLKKAGSSAGTDGDCIPACGNGHVEPGETCDHPVPARRPATTPMSVRTTRCPEAQRTAT